MPGTFGQFIRQSVTQRRIGRDAQPHDLGP